MEKLRLATVFSGIGAVEFALRRLHRPYEIVFACDNGERDITYDQIKEKNAVDNLPSPTEKKKYVEDLYSRLTRKTNFVQKSYLANYSDLLDDNLFFQDINLLDGRDFKGGVDLFVGGSPCQSFSSVGAKKGFRDPRGTLFYQFIRLIGEIQPKVFIYENVRNVLFIDHGETWKTMAHCFDESGYTWFGPEILDAEDYGIPQVRRRLFVVGFKNKPTDFTFPPKKIPLKYTMKDFSINYCPEGNFTYDKNGKIKIKKGQGTVGSRYYLSPLIYRYVMKGGTKSFYQKPVINRDVARTILKTMGSHHRAGVDNYLSFDGTEDVGSVRMLTEREALRLMGFTDDFHTPVSVAQQYKQAGNSIVVDVMLEILKSVFRSWGE